MTVVVGYNNLLIRIATSTTVGNPDDLPIDELPQKSDQKDCVTQSLRKQNGRGLLVRPEEGYPVDRRESRFLQACWVTLKMGKSGTWKILGSRINAARFDETRQSSTRTISMLRRLWSDRKLKKRFICLGTPDRKLIMTGIVTHLQFAGGDFLECNDHDFAISDDITGHARLSLSSSSNSQLQTLKMFESLSLNKTFPASRGK
ncbi:hypothetical protein C8R41DRAFT_905863 [Lentinula lateritia]|uniref:Fungal-type protein kinase domain-containing protein n=1 Tax=Lentinula lateritia TaxID=40482 RepID=A0ABQ8V1C6_9AGAR|nr:hypothetical protein C8R41DRAFT_905863 [Lentinula lateritia]